MKKIVFLLILLFVGVSCSKEGVHRTKSENKNQTIAKDMASKGELIAGLRVYSEEDIESGKLAAFRGDYVRIESNGFFVIDSLKIKHDFSAKNSEEKYFKLKKTGIFEYSFNDIKGIIEISEYEEANYKAINPQEAEELIKNINPLVLDVRTKREYNNGRLENAMLLPVQNIQKEYTKLIDYKNEPILIYCASGNRSTVASRVLIENGFTNVYNLKPGIAGWYRGGKKIVR